MHNSNKPLLYISFVLWARILKWTLAYFFGFALICAILYGLFIKRAVVGASGPKLYLGIIMFNWIIVVGVTWYVFSRKLFAKPINVKGRIWRVGVTENGRLLDFPLPYKNTWRLIWGLSWRTILFVEGLDIVVRAMSHLTHNYVPNFPVKFFILGSLMQVLAFRWLIGVAYGSTRITVESEPNPCLGVSQAVGS